jgi:hypothetical protein
MGLKALGVTKKTEDFEKLPEDGLITRRRYAGVVPVEVTFTDVRLEDSAPKQDLLRRAVSDGRSRLAAKPFTHPRQLTTGIFDLKFLQSITSPSDTASGGGPGRWFGPVTVFFAATWRRTSGETARPTVRCPPSVRRPLPDHLWDLRSGRRRLKHKDPGCAVEAQPAAPPAPKELRPFLETGKAP